MNAPLTKAPAVASNVPVKSRPPGVRTRLEAAFQNRENNEFLPAHIEILETPASPLSGVLLWSLATLLTSAIAWSCFARIDIFAVAPGRVQPSGRSKVVQPFETSKVKAILVENGARVATGTPLVALDDTDTRADLDAKRQNLEAIDAQIARYRATITAIETESEQAKPDFPTSIPSSIREQETSAMIADLAQYFSTRDNLVSKRDGNVATQGRFISSIAARRRLLAVLNERANMKQSLVNTGSGARSAVIDATQQVEQTNTDLAYDEGQLSEAKAAEVTSNRSVQQNKRESIAKQQQALVDSLEKRPSAEQDLAKAMLRQTMRTLSSPIDGTVQQLAVTTVGQVVTSGQPILVVVPTEGPINIEAQIDNKDIGFILPGQEAVIKVDAFPFTRYGTLDGTVTQVSRDAIDAREANASGDANETAKGQSVNPTTGETQTQNLVYPVNVELKRDRVMADGKDVRLTPGMTVSVEIRTGQRRVIDYLIAPILETSSSAGHER